MITREGRETRCRSARRYEPLFREALTIRERPGGNPAELAKTLEAYAALLRSTSREAEAVEMEIRARELSIPAEATAAGI